MAEQETMAVSVRPATHTDCDGIKAINRDLYGGIDRFLYYFHRDIGTESCFAFVAEIPGKIVGYACGEVIEDGEVLVMREGRVKDEYQGLGIIHKINQAMIGAALGKYPQLQKCMWTSFKIDDCRQALARHPFMKLTMHKPLEVFLTHSKHLKALCESKHFLDLEDKYPVNTIRAIPKRDALRLLTEEIRYLDYSPARPMIGWQPRGWHRSTLGAELQKSDLFISRSSPTSEIQAFSFLTTTKNDMGTRVEIIVYCPATERSTDLVIAYLLHGIRELATLHADTPFTCFFFIPNEADAKRVKAVLNANLGLPSNENFDYTGNMVEFSLADNTAQRSKL